MDVSLLTGWLPWTLRIAALAALAAAIGRRDARWYRRELPIALAAALGPTLLGALGVSWFGDLDDPLPFGLWGWTWCALLAVGVLLTGWRGARWWTRAAAPAAMVLAVVCAANSLNIATGYYPDLGDAAADLSGKPVPQQMSLAEARKAVGRAETGRVVAVDIPAQPSGFSHRKEFVYLPPAWFRSKQRPKLPVVEMIGGVFAEPENWIRAGNAVEIADAYAAAHNGNAPILVFADATGDFKTDTECMNGKAGKAEDHLLKDIPKYVSKTFGTATGPKKWAVAGWSMGGTCALTITLAHPDVFGRFLDISGDPAPSKGDRKQTLEELFDGDEQAMAAHDPTSLLAASRRDTFKGVSGWFAVGEDETKRVAQLKKLEPAAKATGIATRVSVIPGKHNWQVAATAFEEALPWLAQELGTPGAKPAKQPAKPAGSPSPSPTAPSGSPTAPPGAPSAASAAPAASPDRK
ncbi:alpha/beta hydrolase [Kitasatospora camelliae]|uniref:Alpha/beta hydrolase-fold protein n=1 Tax=Kitasatospora camelliae TaxID=3156397 RepID=A0AAU8JU12_9ACTN